VAALIAAQRDGHQTRTGLPAGRREYPGPGPAGTNGLSFRRGQRGGRPWLQRPAGCSAPARGTYGPPRITAGLREGGWQVSENTVAALMREQGRAARRKKKRRPATRAGGGRWRAADLVKRDFPADRLNLRWHGGGTEIKTGEGRLCLASVTGMASRRVLGFALGEHHDARLAYSALVMAVAGRGGRVPGVIMHAGRGQGGHRGPGPAGLPPALDLPADGAARVRAGQRGHRVLALPAGVRAPLARAVRYQGSGPGPGQRPDRGLQHQAAALRPGQDDPGPL